MNPDPTNRQPADDRPLSHTPGSLDDKETASAYANRTDQADTTALTPERAELRGAEESQPGEHGDTRQAQQEDDPGTTPIPPLGADANPLR